MHVDTHKYPPQIQELLAPLGGLSFDYSKPNDVGVKKTLARLGPQDFCQDVVQDEQMAKCCLSGLWLLQGFLSESHEISQSVHTREGSYWHAIMHRAEGDFWNSKYWYRKVSVHPVLDSLQEPGMTGDELVDLCEQATSDTVSVERANEFARREWTLLFDHCWNFANGY